MDRTGTTTLKIGFFSRKVVIGNEEENELVEDAEVADDAEVQTKRHRSAIADKKHEDYPCYQEAMDQRQKHL